jgi:hypothetical protein
MRASENKSINTEYLKSDATAKRKLHVPPPPKGELVLALLPNIVLPVVLLLLLLAPNMLVPVFAAEPKPGAEGKLDTVRREARGAGEGRVGAVARRSPRNPNRKVLLTGSCIVVGRSKSAKARRLLVVVVVGAEAPETTAEGHFEVARRVARV